jgi:hypothetical protein
MSAVDVASELEAFHEKRHDVRDFIAVPKSMPNVPSLVAGYVVLPHVQRFADDVRKATAVKTIGTYPGHSPSLERALDLFHAVRDTALSEAICNYALGNVARYGVRYVISRQRIWHRLDPVWRGMEDRGDNTQNHYDHVHISFETTAAGGPDPEPEPEPEPQGDPRMLTFRYIYNDLDWVFDGPSGLFFQCDDAKQITEVLDPLGVKALGKVSPVTHRRYSDLARSAGFAS